MRPALPLVHLLPFRSILPINSERLVYTSRIHMLVYSVPQYKQILIFLGSVCGELRTATRLLHRCTPHRCCCSAAVFYSEYQLFQYSWNAALL